MSEEIVYHRKEEHEQTNAVSYPANTEEFKLTIKHEDEEDVLLEFLTKEEGIESLTYTRVTPEELYTIGSLMMGAGKKP
jgi:hypothetical protein